MYCHQSLSLKQNNININQWLQEMNKVHLWFLPMKQKTNVFICACLLCCIPNPYSLCFPVALAIVVYCYSMQFLCSLFSLNPFFELQAWAGQLPGDCQFLDDLAMASNLSLWSGLVGACVASIEVICTIWWASLPITMHVQSVAAIVAVSWLELKNSTNLLYPEATFKESIK